MNTEQFTFDDFREEWLKEISDGEPSTVEKGRRFATKIFSQWQEIVDDCEFFYCDGCSDGGIDISYQKSDYDEDGELRKKTWYIVQSKYGSSYQGPDTLVVEAVKIFHTLNGINEHLSEQVKNIVEAFNVFKQTLGEEDKIVLVFATVDSLSGIELESLANIKTIGQDYFGNNFDVETISLQTIYNRIQDDIQSSHNIVPINANLVPSGENLLVGSIKLINIYNFMKEFKKTTNDLEILYEKNVRQYLGGRKKVNKGIEKTIINEPEKFGLYNNGITIVVEDYKQTETDVYKLINPYVVNGCQTTRTIWDVLYKRLEYSGSKKNDEIEEWKLKLNEGIVIIKIVKAGEDGDELLKKTTEYTNSQNSVGPKDFISLDKNFQSWSPKMQEKYNVFLEIQRGSWDCQKIKMRQNPNNTCAEYINAIEALKIYGAGWKKVPGISFGKTPPFAPGGTLFNEITKREDFGVNDIYAAFLLKKLTDERKFGKDTQMKHIGKARYLFYYIIVELIQHCMNYNGIELTESNITKSIIVTLKDLNDNKTNILYNNAYQVIESYYDSSNENCLYNESSYTKDINAFFKLDKLIENTSHLKILLMYQKQVLNMSGRNLISDSIKDEFRL